MILKNPLFILLMIIVYLLSNYLLLKLYVKLLLGRGDIKTKKGFEHSDITLIKWLALIIVSITISFLMLGISMILGIITMIVSLIIFLLTISLIRFDIFSGGVLYPWDWWILKLIEKKKK